MSSHGEIFILLHPLPPPFSSCFNREKRGHQNDILVNAYRCLIFIIL